MDKHVNITGIVWIVYGAMGLIAGIIVAMALLGTGMIVGIAGGIEDTEVPIGILTIVGIFVGGGLVIFSIPDIIAGIGILKYKEWARILTIVLSIINLINIPFGTIIGGYSLWVLFNKDTIPLFQQEKS